MVATTSAGHQVRITVGRWPLISTEDAREIAIKLLRECRSGKIPTKQHTEKLPTLRELLPNYAKAKNIKRSSLARYESMLRVHFSNWQDCHLHELSSAAFFKHCHEFAQTKGAALVEVGRGLIGALIKYINAVHGLQLKSPFQDLAAAGLMPDRAQPRLRRLQETDLAAWYQAVQVLPDKQRDMLMLLALTGLRRNEAASLRKNQIDLATGVMHIPETKTGHPHSLPTTPMLVEILKRRIHGLAENDLLFAGVSQDHLAEMTIRAGAPKFMLHDLRKLLATAGEKLGNSDAILRRILNHKAKKSDTLHRHYVQLSIADIEAPLTIIQERLLGMMKTTQ